MPFTTLIDPQTLAAHLSDPDLAVIDCRYDLRDEAWGCRGYEASHVPGAVYAGLDRDLSGVKTGRNGRHPLPDPQILAATFGRLGIAAGMQVVAYDQDNGMFASRLWWLLRWMGHDRVAVLDGGLAAWISENGPLQSGVETRPPRHFEGTPRPDQVATAEQTADLAARPGWRLVDARSPDRYRGENETIDAVAGRIPGAVNHFFRWNVNEDGTFRSVDEIRDRVKASIGAVPPDRVVCYCGSGVTACQNLLAFEHAGLSGARLFPGSWSEWSSDPARPIETGPIDKGAAGQSRP
ncbi:MAG: sulfurtransferase [Acidobacteriota bacterium]